MDQSTAIPTQKGIVHIPTLQDHLDQQIQQGATLTGPQHQALIKLSEGAPAELRNLITTDPHHLATRDFDHHIEAVIEAAHKVNRQHNMAFGQMALVYGHIHWYALYPHIAAKMGANVEIATPRQLAHELEDGDEGTVEKAVRFFVDCMPHLEALDIAPSSVFLDDEMTPEKAKYLRSAARHLAKQTHNYSEDISAEEVEKHRGYIDAVMQGGKRQYYPKTLDTLGDTKWDDYAHTRAPLLIITSIEKDKNDGKTYAYFEGRMDLEQVLAWIANKVTPTPADVEGHEMTREAVKDRIEAFDSDLKHHHVL